MKKIFLVDDEIVVREGIRNCIDWIKEGFDYCGDAPDGEIALPLIEKQQPDIVITDIKMPFMDGLEMCRVLRKKMPQIKIVILSGHDEFEYAREAMRIDINEYCLKPISADELLQILTRVSLQIEYERRERQKLIELESQANQSITMKREKFLLELCEGCHTTSYAINEATKLGIPLIANYYFVLIIDSENIQTVHSLDKVTYVRFNRKMSETVLIFQGETIKQLEAIITEIKIQMEMKTKQNNQHYGVGTIKDRILEISHSFSEAYEQKYYQSKQHHILFNETLPTFELQLNFNKKDLQHFLKFGHVNEINSFCKNYVMALKEKINEKPFWYYYCLIDFTNVTIEFLKEFCPQSTCVLDKVKKIEMKANKDIDYIIQYMIGILEIVINHRDKSKSKNFPIIQKAKDFIQEHFQNPDLSLQMISNNVNVSPSYFSHLFSQETGQTLKEYVTTTRIEKAKDLLLMTNEKTYEIALKVGYNDSHYFCNMFKKITGMTTKTFKNQRQKSIY
ncbi:response regulator transcription factor [Alkalihalobacterium bogoriense]|uniref:response regulator transcription factor n=1 Tax=Alkalihalobacterium bogoriense TaxID=246272 RepID=UPI000479F069|nr:response regulator [Alkalihalobacterium bogoriense]